MLRQPLFGCFEPLLEANLAAVSVAGQYDSAVVRVCVAKMRPLFMGPLAVRFSCYGRVETRPLPEKRC